MNILALDYSTQSTGYSIYSEENQKLIKFGIIKPNIKRKKGEGELSFLLNRLHNIGDQILSIIKEFNPEIILIEEVNFGRAGRLSQKTLNGGHFILLTSIRDYISRVKYVDSDGKTGWRTILGIKFSTKELRRIKDLKKLNKGLKGKSKHIIRTRKHLACDYANKEFSMTLNPDSNKADADLGDSLCLLLSFLKTRKKDILS